MNTDSYSKIPQDILDQETIDNLLFLGEDVFKEIIELYLQEAPKKYAEILSCAKAADAESLSSTAHSMKGASLNIGAHYLAETCLQIEHLGKSGNLSGIQQMLDDLEKRYQQTVIALQAFS